jgi:hypothetical protein
MVRSNLRSEIKPRRRRPTRTRGDPADKPAWPWGLSNDTNVTGHQNGALKLSPPALVDKPIMTMGVIP